MSMRRGELVEPDEEYDNNSDYPSPGSVASSSSVRRYQPPVHHTQSQQHQNQQYKTQPQPQPQPQPHAHFQAQRLPPPPPPPNLSYQHPPLQQPQQQRAHPINNIHHQHHQQAGRSSSTHEEIEYENTDAHDYENSNNNNEEESNAETGTESDDGTMYNSNNSNMHELNNSFGRVSIRSSSNTPPRTIAPDRMSQILSSNASMKIELQNAQYKCSILEKQLKTATIREKEAQLEVKKLRSQCMQLEKELSALKRSHDKLVAGRTDNEKKLAEEKNYTKRLEAKLAMGARGLGVVENYKNLEAKVLKLKEKCQLQDETIKDQLDKLQQQALEIKVLNSALEIKADDMSSHAGELKTSLLYEVAKNRNEAENLREELRRKTEAIEELQRENVNLQATINDYYQARENINAELAQKDAELAELRAQFEAVHQEHEAFKSERGVLLDYIEESAKEMSVLKEKNEQMAQELEDLKHKKQLEHEHHTSKQTSFNQEIKALRDKVQNMETMQSITEQQVREEQRKNKDLSENLHRLTEQNNKLAAEVNNLMLEVEQLTEVNEKLQNDLANTHLQHETDKQRLDQLQHDYDKISAEHDKLKNERNGVEANLKNKLKETLVDFQNLLEDRDKIKTARDEIASKYSSAVAAQQQLEKRNQELEEQLANVKESQSLLQKTMLEQIASIKKKYEQVYEENRVLRAKYQTLEQENSRLEIFVEARKKSQQSMLLSTTRSSLNSSTVTATPSSATLTGGGSGNHFASSRESSPAANNNSTCFNNQLLQQQQQQQQRFDATPNISYTTDYDNNGYANDAEDGNNNNTNTYEKEKEAFGYTSFDHQHEHHKYQHQQQLQQQHHHHDEEYSSSTSSHNKSTASAAGAPTEGNNSYAKYHYSLSADGTTAAVPSVVVNNRPPPQQQQQQQQQQPKRTLSIIELAESTEF